MARKITSANEMFDLLGSMNAGSYATVCHIDYAKIDNPKKQIINPLTNRKNKVVDFDLLGDKLEAQGLVGIISITRYRQLNWTPQNKLGAKYVNYKNQANAIRQEFGVPAMKVNPKVYQTIGYGNGISVGATDKTEGKGYTHQNTYSANKDVTYYGVNNQGHVIKEFTLAELKEYLGERRTINGLAQLKKLTQDNRIIDNYIQRILDLKMEYTTFLNDRIIYMIGATDDGKFYFINNNLTSMIEDIPIIPSEFIEITKQLYHLDYQTMNEAINKQKKLIENNMKKNTVRLTEAQLHRVIKESVKNVIKEEYSTMDSDTLSAIQNYNGLEMGGFDAPFSKNINEIEKSISRIRHQIRIMSLGYKKGNMSYSTSRIIDALDNSLHKFEERLNYLKQRLVNKTGENFKVGWNEIDQDGNIY